MHWHEELGNTKIMIQPVTEIARPEGGEEQGHDGQQNADQREHPAVVISYALVFLHGPRRKEEISCDQNGGRKDYPFRRGKGKNACNLSQYEADPLRGIPCPEFRKSGKDPRQNVDEDPENKAAQESKEPRAEKLPFL